MKTIKERLLARKQERIKAYIMRRYATADTQPCVVEYSRLKADGSIETLGVAIIPRAAECRGSLVAGYSHTTKLFIVKSFHRNDLANILFEDTEGDTLLLNNLFVRPI